jgi:hypothetical protein
MNAVAGVLGMEPDDIEGLLPWHAAGTLNARDARRVEEALSRDTRLARQFAVIQDEYAETIHVNESLGAPSSQAMQRLFAAIEAEPARQRAAASGFGARIVEFFAGLSPRTLALASGAAVVAILLQAAVIGAALVKDRPAGFESASSASVNDAAPQALVRFAPDARMSDIATLLGAYNAAIVEGGVTGAFRIRIGDKAMSRDEFDRVLARLQAEKSIGFAAAAAAAR